MGNVTVSTNPGGRLNVGGKYVYVSFHPYLGPEFFDSKDNPFEPENEAQEERMWEEFGKWLKKFNANEEKLRKQGKSIYRSVQPPG